MREAMIKAALLGVGASLPQYNPAYEYNLQWLFEEDHIPVPKEQTFKTVYEALNAMTGIISSGKTLTHISLSRRNA